MYEREQAINPPEYDEIDEEQAEENRERQADADRYYNEGGL